MIQMVRVLIVFVVLLPSALGASGLRNKIEGNDFNRLFCTYFDEPGYDYLTNSMNPRNYDPAIALAFAHRSAAEVAEAADIVELERLALTRIAQTANYVRDRAFGQRIAACAGLHSLMLSERPAPDTLGLVIKLIESLEAPAMKGGILRRALDDIWVHPASEQFRPLVELAVAATGNARVHSSDRVALAGQLFRQAVAWREDTLWRRAQAGIQSLMSDRSARTALQLMRFSVVGYDEFERSDDIYAWAERMEAYWGQIRGNWDMSIASVPYVDDAITILGTTAAVLNSRELHKYWSGRSDYNIARTDQLFRDQQSLTKIRTRLLSSEPPSSLYSRRMVLHRAAREARLTSVRVTSEHDSIREILRWEHPDPVRHATVGIETVRLSQEVRLETAAYDWRARTVIAPIIDQQIVSLALQSSDIPEGRLLHANLVLALMQASESTGAQMSAALARARALPQTGRNTLGPLATIHMQLNITPYLREAILAAPPVSANRGAINDYHLRVGAIRTFTSWGLQETLTRMGHVGQQLGSILNPPMVQVADIQSALSADEAALVAFPTHGRTALLVVNKRGFEFIVTDMPRDKLSDTALQLRRSIDAAGSPGSTYDAQSARALYNATLRAAEPHLTGVRHIYWIGIGDYGALPPSILMDGDRYAVERWTFTSLTSVQAVTEQRRTSALAKTTRFVGIGGVDLDADALAQGPVATGNPFAEPNAPNCDETRMSRESAPLECTPALIRTLADRFGGNATLLFGEAATHEEIIDALPGANVIAFGTHGLVGDRQAATEPGLVISAKGDDGLLSVSEVLTLRLAEARLVILAACDTAAGRGHPTSEPFDGLVRAFRSAGAQNVIASHWQVFEAAATDILGGMARRMEKVDSISEALRGAMLDALADPDPLRSHPGWWGAFVMVGTEDSI